MRNEVKYEWCYEIIETVSGDIIDHDFSESLANMATPTLEPGQHFDLCLIRDEGNNDDGLQERLYAYVKRGILPAMFSNVTGLPVAVNVPKKFQQEFLKSNP